MEYLIFKYIHIISSTVLFGTGIGSAFYVFMANRRKELPAIVFTTRYVVLADWLFTAPAAIIQLITGLVLVHIRGYDLSQKWIIYSLILYFSAGACWLAVVWIQIKMRDIAKITLDSNSELPVIYWIYDKWWIVLGSMAFPMIIIVFYLMVFKPA